MVLSSRKDISRIGKAAGSLKDDDVFPRPLHVWSTASRFALLIGCLGRWSSVPSFLGEYRVPLEADLAGPCRLAIWPDTAWQNLNAITKSMLL